MYQTFISIIKIELFFCKKQNAKILLEKCFIINKDYTLLIPQHKQSCDTKGGHNKQIFLLNIRTFKLFCIKAGTVENTNNPRGICKPHKSMPHP